MQKIIGVLLIITAISLVACSKTTKPTEEGLKQTGREIPGSRGQTKGLDLMAEKYGITAEELEGINVEILIEDYQLDKMDYSAEEVRQIIEDQGKFYWEEPQDDIYALLGDTNDIPSSGKDLTRNADIIKIAFYENPGSLQKKMIFDLEAQVCYIDNAVPFELSTDQVSALKNIASISNITSWQHRYENNNEIETTGSYAWKMVFLLSNGEQCVYGGYTQDMTSLPEDYFTVVRAFESTVN